MMLEETPLGVLLRTGRKDGKGESYTPARLAEFERNNEGPLKRIRLG